MPRALKRIGFDDGAAGLVGKQINRVRSMVPQQVIGPTAGLTECVHVGSAEEVSLHIHLLNVELTRLDFVMNPLMTGVETACVATHGHLAFFLGQAHHFFRVFPTVCQWNLDLNVLSRF